jgi:FkbM family methyltransferase
MAEAMQHVAARGYRPATVIDVGVAWGTEDLYEAFPRAKHLLIEAIAEFEPKIREVVAGYDHELVLAAAGAAAGELTIHVQPQMSWSSMFRPLPEFPANSKPRQVPTVRIDELCKEKGLRGPYLLKVDVEGAELEVMAGATGILAETDVVVLEVAFPEEYQNVPTFAEIIRRMDELGYAVYDMFDLRTASPDRLLYQSDVVFVKRGSPIRKLPPHAPI